MRYAWMTWHYLVRMLPGVLAALALYVCLHPWRKRRLKATGLVSSRWREAVLALFWMFCGGMAMGTLTPWGFSLFDALRWGWPEPFFQLGDVNLIPFQTFSLGGILLYTLLGNIIMFLPFGFFQPCCGRDTDGNGFSSRACALRASSSVGSCLWDGPLTLMICC